MKAWPASPLTRALLLLVLLLPALGAVVGVTVCRFLPANYEASARFETAYGDVPGTSGFGGVEHRDVIQRAVRLYRRDFPSTGISDAELISSLSNQTTIRRLSGAAQTPGLFCITVRVRDPGASANLVRAYLKSMEVCYVEQRRQKEEEECNAARKLFEQKKRTLAASEAALETCREKVVAGRTNDAALTASKLQAQEAYALAEQEVRAALAKLHACSRGGHWRGPVTIVEEAHAPGTPVNYAWRLAAGGVAGALLGLLPALLLDVRRTHVITPSKV